MLKIIVKVQEVQANQLPVTNLKDVRLNQEEPSSAFERLFALLSLLQPKEYWFINKATGEVIVTKAISQREADLNFLCAYGMGVEEAGFEDITRKELFRGE